MEAGLLPDPDFMRAHPGFSANMAMAGSAVHTWGRLPNVCATQVERFRGMPVNSKPATINTVAGSCAPGLNLFTKMLSIYRKSSDLK